MSAGNQPLERLRRGRSTRTPGRYSYNRIGEDLVAFIDAVIGRPALVAGLSSGGVLALWLGANAPAEVLAVIAEDPPIFSSVWPRIAEEKYLAHTFRTAVATLGGERRDLRAFHAQMGIPNPKGGDELLRYTACNLPPLEGWTACDPNGDPPAICDCLCDPDFPG